MRGNLPAPRKVQLAGDYHQVWEPHFRTQLVPIELPEGNTQTSMCRELEVHWGPRGGGVLDGTAANRGHAMETSGGPRLFSDDTDAIKTGLGLVLASGTSVCRCYREEGLRAPGLPWQRGSLGSDSTLFHCA